MQYPHGIASLISDAHFRNLFKTMREVKANYKGNNLQHRVVKKLSKAARDCGITSLGSYRLEYKERQKQYNARRNAASAVQVIKLLPQIHFICIPAWNAMFHNGCGV